jgi:hypothetical protein
MKFAEESHINIEIVGGLGNQLFQFFAGKFLAERQKADLVLNIDRLGCFASNHGFQLPTVIKNENYVIAHSGNPNLSARISRFSEALQRRLIPEKITKLIWKQYNSDVVGYDLNVEKLPGIFRIRGYFQSYRYFQSNSAYRDMVELLNPSNWYHSVYSEISAVNSIVIHIRRGDYAELRNSFGILDNHYYKRAVSIANEILDFPKYFVFSDDINEAKRILDFLPSNQSSFIQPPSMSNPAESLFLMAQGKVLITANSTFSLWSGLLGNECKTVITPEKWFKSLEDPLDLRPPNWIHCLSSWE